MSKKYGRYTEKELLKYEKEILPMLRKMPKREAAEYLKEHIDVARMMFSHIEMCKDKTLPMERI